MNEKDNILLEGKEKWTAGTLLIVIGLLALVGQLLPNPELGYFIVPALAVIFLVWGIISRQVGLLIPGGVLAGIGLGIFLTRWLYGGVEAAGTQSAGTFLLSFAAGWGLIILLSALFTDKTHWWPLIPGSILAVIGAGLLIGGVAQQLLQWLGLIWPVILIAAGIYLILRRANANAHP
jgi:hypothetical protein